MNKLLAIVLIFITLPSIALAADVKNIIVNREGDKAIVTYDLVATAGEQDAEVTVSINLNGQKYTSDHLHLTGDLGKNVKVGNGKRIVWDSTVDLPTDVESNTKWEISAVKATAILESTYTDLATGMEFILVPGGCYQMGDSFGGEAVDEKPVHKVCVSDFYMGKYLVTQAQWQKILGNNPSSFTQCGGSCPVDKVSWEDTHKYILQLNALTGKNFRLPYEAEWEYAARSGGKQEKWAGTSDLGELSSFAWFADNSSIATHPVGAKKPNGLGLYDMSGNVWEWCEDWYSKDYYQNSPEKDPQGPPSGSTRVFRGGSWYVSANHGYTARRFRDNPGARCNDYGFRLVLPTVQLSKNELPLSHSVTVLGEVRTLP